MGGSCVRCGSFHHFEQQRTQNGYWVFRIASVFHHLSRYRANTRSVAHVGCRGTRMPDIAHRLQQAEALLRHRDAVQGGAGQSQLQPQRRRRPKLPQPPRRHHLQRRRAWSAQGSELTHPSPVSRLAQGRAHACTDRCSAVQYQRRIIAPLVPTWEQEVICRGTVRMPSKPCIQVTGDVIGDSSW